jgi:hypothetical protein
MKMNARNDMDASIIISNEQMVKLDRKRNKIKELKRLIEE